MIAKLVRFYGLSPDEVLNLDNDMVFTLSEAIAALKAQETMELMKVADWPNMKKEARSKLFKDLNKAANPSIVKEERKALSTQDLAALLNGR